MSADIRLITFDLDNTLWPVHEVIVNAEQQMRAWLDEQVPGFNRAYDQDAMLALRTELLAEQPQLAPDLSRMRVAILQAALTGYGEAPARAAALAGQAFDIFMEGRHRVRYYEGATETLTELARHYTLAALSNGNADIGRLALDRFFAFSFSAANVGTSKPHPAMFEAALRQANVRPDQAVHVGDHLIDDIDGAGAIGMHTIWVDFERSAQGPMRQAQTTMAPSRIVHQLAAIPAAITSLE